MPFESLEVFDKALPLIVEDINGKLTVNAPVAAQISQITAPLVVVAIAGAYKTGKSYLINGVAGETGQFPLGSTVEATTKGIWVKCRMHPKRPGHVMLLLDTEGLSDIQKADISQDIQIFTLATLLSSVLVYNMFGVFSQRHLDELSFITEMCTKLRAQTGERADLEFQFPTFVLTLRDFWLQMKIKGKPVTPQMYMEEFCLSSKGDTADPRVSIRKNFPTRKCFVFDRPTNRSNMHRLDQLTEKDLSPDFVEDTEKFKEFIFTEGRSKEVKDGRAITGSRDTADPRVSIRKNFPTRKCFVFDRPTNRSNMHRLDQLTEKDLSPDFVEDTEKFKEFIFTEGRSKEVKDGRAITGSMFTVLLDGYVGAIRDGSVPDVASTLQTLYVIENEKAVDATVAGFKSLMDKEPLPTYTEQILLNKYLSHQSTALGTFTKRCFKEGDPDGKFHTKAMDLMKAFYEYLKAKNEAISIQRCREKLVELKRSVYTSSYIRPGGYPHYRTAMNALEANYNACANLGPKKAEILLAFQEENKDEDTGVCNADTQLTREKKEIENIQRIKNEAERREQLEKANAARKDAEIQRIRTINQQEIANINRQRQADLANEQRAFETRLKTRLASEEQKFSQRLADQKQQLTQPRSNAIGLFSCTECGPNTHVRLTGFSFHSIEVSNMTISYN